MTTTRPSVPDEAEEALARASRTALPSDPATRSAFLLPLLDDARAKLAAAADRWVEVAAAAKQCEPSEAIAAEELASGPLAVARALAGWRRSLVALRAGRLPSVQGRVRRAGDARFVPAMPCLPFDRLVFASHRARGDGLPVVVKLHPLHAGLRELFASTFAAFADAGCSFVAGDGAFGATLARDPRVSDVHLTGSRSTFAALAQSNAMRPTPARLSAELGNVTPVVVVPGTWRDAELRARADDVAAMLSNNGGFNCASARVLITARRWPQRESFLAFLRERLSALPPRPAWHPGSAARFVSAGGRPADDGRLPCVLLECADPDSLPHAFRDEVFAPLLVEHSLDGADLTAYLRSATQFCATRLSGDLAAVVLAPRAVLARDRAAIDGFCGSLRYGTVGLNVWAAVGFAWMATPWGAFRDPRGAPSRSGVGFVHDSLLLRAPRRSFLRGPILPWPTPAWWPSHRSPRAVMERLLALTLAPSPWRCARVVSSAIAGRARGR
ncbi:MAG: aldehyde dehydrogenase family protein [Planctomycetes bacterium]|nr:aldehyde dehydrogenase family protein [Planctomycetota bacterium]